MPCIKERYLNKKSSYKGGAPSTGANIPCNIPCTPYLLSARTYSDQSGMALRQRFFSAIAAFSIIMVLASSCEAGCLPTSAAAANFPGYIPALSNGKKIL
jgi:hypothetical protein